MLHGAKARGHGKNIPLAFDVAELRSVTMISHDDAQETTSRRTAQIGWRTSFRSCSERRKDSELRLEVQSAFRSGIPDAWVLPGMAEPMIFSPLVKLVICLVLTTGCVTG